MGERAKKSDGFRKMCDLSVTFGFCLERGKRDGICFLFQNLMAHCGFYPVNILRLGVGDFLAFICLPLPCLPCLNHPPSSTSQSGWFFQTFFIIIPFGMLTLLLSGGGVGGLTLAYALSKSPDICIDVYEAASKFTEIGAGIGVWWRTRQVLKSLGLEEDVIRLLTFRPGQDRGELEEYSVIVRDSEVFVVPSIQYRKGDQPDGFAMGTMYSRGLIVLISQLVVAHGFFSSHLRSGELMGVHRAEFHEVLLNRLSSRCHTSPSKRLESYSQQPGAPIVLKFQDGSTATCDILIGADGLKSAVRKTMFQEAATRAESQCRNSDAAELRSLSEPRFLGVLAHRMLIPAARLSNISPHHRALSSAVQVRCSLFGVSDLCVLPFAVPRQEQGRLTLRRSFIIPDLSSLP
jgi:hypothetical protein